MQFNSLAFLVFFTIVCAMAALLRGERHMRLRHIMLLIASYVFYGWWNWKFCFLMLLMTAVAYISALSYSRSGRKLSVYIGVIFPLIVLGIFKYFNFFVGSFCAAFGIANPGTLNIILPVGISFYTFQSLSYTIDVYRGKLEAEKDFVRLALYIAFFPQLVAGPIVKAGDFIPQLYENRNISFKNIELGVQYFAFGLFKKIVLADNISVFVDAVYRTPEAYSAITLVLVAFAYSIQIYGDFSGYSDMAVGCARCLGYDLPRNFNLPFLSKTITSLWRNWHMTLSAWLHEYLYVSLGGNRKGKVRTYINLLLTMVLGGLWHGAAWTFVLWGTINGVGLAIHKYISQDKNKTPFSEKNAFTATISTIFTFSVFAFTVLIFRADSIDTAMRMLYRIITWQSGITHISFWAVFGLIITAIASIAAIVRSRKNGTAIEGYYPIVKLDTIKGLTVFFCFIGLIFGLCYTGETPFIYFQF